MVDLWVLVTVGYSFVCAAYMMANDVFKLPGDVAVFWRSVFATLITLPFCFFIDWPTDWQFYAFIGLGGVVCAIGDIIMFEAFKDHGGAAISRMWGLRPVLLFLLWPFFHHATFDELARYPLMTTGIIACLVVIALTLFMARKNPVGRAAFLAILPAIFLFTAGDIAWKFATPTAASFDRLIAITFFSMVIMVIVTGGYKLARHSTIIIPKKLWISGSVNGLLVIGVCMIKSFALSIAPNPSYVNAISLIFVLWTYLVHKYLLKKEDNASPIAGFVVVGAAAILMILVEQIH